MTIKRRYANHESMPPFTGRHHTEKTKQLKSRIQTEKWEDSIYAQMMREADRNASPFTKEHRRNISLAQKSSIVCRVNIKKLNEAKIGTHHNNETRHKMSVSHKKRWDEMSEEGRIAQIKPLIGQKQSAKQLEYARKPKGVKHRQAIREAHLKLWQDPDFAHRRRKELGIRPNKTEQRLTSWFDEQFPGEWKYVGDGTVWIGGKNPDWININGKKALVEYNGHYSHTPERDAIKTAIYAQYGFTTIHIYPSDLEDLSGLRTRLMKMERAAGVMD